jgi:hypothetical protein
MAMAATDCKGRTDMSAGFGVGCSSKDPEQTTHKQYVPKCTKVPYLVRLDASYKEVVNWIQHVNPGMIDEADRKKQVERVMSVTCYVGEKAHKVYIFKPAPGDSVPGVDPATLAQTVFAGMDLDPITLGKTPLNKDKPATVGVPMWLWVEEALLPDSSTAKQHSFGPWTVKKSGITLTAQVDYVDFSLDDGSKKTCLRANLARPWTPDDPRADEKSPDCSLTPVKSKQDMKITASAHWVANWTAKFNGKTFSGKMTTTYPVARYVDVQEIQVVKIPG